MNNLGTANRKTSGVGRSWTGLEIDYFFSSLIFCMHMSWWTFLFICPASILFEYIHIGPISAWQNSIEPIVVQYRLKQYASWPDLVHKPLSFFCHLNYMYACLHVAEKQILYAHKFYLYYHCSYSFNICNDCSTVQYIRFHYDKMLCLYIAKALTWPTLRFRFNLHFELWIFRSEII